MNETYILVFKKMCSFVGADFDSIDFSAAEWFQSHSWTLESENDFKKWMIDLLTKSSKARKEIMQIPSKNPVIIKKTVNMFMLNYGWSTL